MKLIDVLNHHLSGGKFEYRTFDFKGAAAEYSESDEWKKICLGAYPHVLGLKDKYQIPEEIREKHSFFRIGKLRSLEFAPNGAIFKIRLGAKWACTFYQQDLKDNLRLI